MSESELFLPEPSPPYVAPSDANAQNTTSSSSTATGISSLSSVSGAPKKKGFSETVKGMFASLDPVASNVSKEFYSTIHQVAQIAGEKFGKVESTPLPQEYLELEQKVDRIKALHENLSKVAALQVNPGSATDIKFSVYGAINDVVDTFGNDPNLASMNEKLRTVTVNPQNPNKLISEEFRHAGEAVKDSSLGQALLKVSEAQLKIGEARSAMNTAVNEKFIIKLALNVETNIRQANHYRRVVYNSRIKLDALKNRSRSATNSEKMAEFEEELKVGHAEFNSLVTLTIDLMKIVVASNEPLVALTDMMTAMLTYFKTGYDLLSVLVPELQASKDVQEALQEHGMSDNEELKDE